MGKMKDVILSENETTDQVQEPTFEDIQQYYDAKEQEFKTNVIIFNNNLLSIINELKSLIYDVGTKTSKEAEKTILECIKRLKLENDKE